MKAEIKTLVDSVLPQITSALNCTGSGAIDYDIEAPKTDGHGDLSINLAFRLAKVARKPPTAVADTIKKILEEEIAKNAVARSVVAKIETAHPGFVNFFLTHGAAGQVLKTIHEAGDRYGHSTAGEGVRALIEFVSANPTGPLTIAHGRQAIVGDVLARLFRETGHHVSCEYYLNDAGRQIRMLGASVLSRYADLIGGTYAFPEEGYRGDYIKDLAEAFKKKEGSKVPLTDEGAKKAGAFAAEQMMGLIRADLKRLDVSFDTYFSESTLYQGKVAESLEMLTKSKMLYEQDGALWFRATAFGDEKDRVVRKSSGEFTYLAPDIAYHRDKFSRGFNRLINLMGPDHHGYVARLKAACQALGYNPEQLHVLIVQLVSLYRNGEPYRMSTRAGDFVTLKELMDEVGEDATRIFFIQRRVESHLDFDVELAKKRSDENPVFYLQYAHARIASIIAFSGRKILREVNTALLGEPETLLLIKYLTEFPDRLVDAARRLEPFRVVDYLRELSAAFHKFYAAHRVVSEDEALTDARLYLVDAVRIVLKNGLGVLGVKAPEKM